MTPNQKIRRWAFRLMKAMADDWRVPVASPEFNTGMILLCSVRLATTNESQLADVTGFSIEFIARVAARCRKAKIWRGHKIRSAWMAKRHGDIAFLLDAMVATGAVIRSAPEPDRAKYQQIRTARRERGVCLNCGRCKSGERAICDQCRLNMKASAERRKASDGRLTVLKETEPLYGLSPEKAAEMDEQMKGEGKTQ